MRTVRLLVGGAPRHGLVRGDRVVLLDGDPLAGSAAETRQEVALEGAALLPPCRPSKIVAVGRNYRAHAAEQGEPIPDEPLLFLKPPSALIPSRASIERPAGFERVDYEGELGVVIGRRARRVSEAEALSYVFGYTLVNDVTVRDLQKREVQFTRAKGFDTFCPVGPCIATDLDPSRLRLRTRVNGVVRQDASCAEMKFGPAQLVSFVSHVMTLEPGDLLSTGTPHGVGNLVPGDTVEVEIEEIGALVNPVVAAPERTP